MSPTRKKTAKKKATASRATKKKTSAKASPKASPTKAKDSRKKAAAPKTAGAKKAPAKKTAAAKKAAGAKPAPKKRSPKKTAAAPPKKAAKTSKPIRMRQQGEAVADDRAKQAKATSAPAAPKKRPPRGKAIPISQVPHPKLGLKFECFKCQAKFYDLGKPDPICPKCGTDQRDRPRVMPKHPVSSGRRVGERPMVPLLDDEDEVASEVVSFEDAAEVVPSPPEVDMFDDAADASAEDDEIFDVEEDKTRGHPIVDDDEEP